MPLCPLPRRLRWRLAALLFLVSAAAAIACPLCYEAARQLMTEGVQLDMAERVVLAVPGADTSQLRIVAVIKGKDAVGDLIADPVIDIDGAAGSLRRFLPASA